MSEKELQDWIDEGLSPFLLPKRTYEHRSLADRVQWFRAEAEMQRWLEEVEIKLTDFLRSIRSFQKMSQASQYCIHIISLSEHVIDVAQLGDNTSAGKAVYARKKSAMYKRMEDEARRLLESVGYHDLLDHIESGRSLSNFILEQRQRAEFVNPVSNLLLKVMFHPLHSSKFSPRPQDSTSLDSGSDSESHDLD